MNIINLEILAAIPTILLIAVVTWYIFEMGKRK